MERSWPKVTFSSKSLKRALMAECRYPSTCQAAWDGNNVWDTKVTPSGDVVDFQLPDAPDPRKLQFKFHCTSPATGQSTWEADDFTRRLFLTSPAEVWTFESSPRILYQNPFPAGIVFNSGDVLTFQVITQKAFRGGQI